MLRLVIVTLLALLMLASLLLSAPPFLRAVGIDCPGLLRYVHDLREAQVRSQQLALKRQEIAQRAAATQYTLDLWLRGRITLETAMYEMRLVRGDLLPRQYLYWQVKGKTDDEKLARLLLIWAEEEVSRMSVYQRGAILGRVRQEVLDVLAKEMM